LFKLTDYDDESVTDADFRDWLALIYFGYAYCPDIYSTNLQVMGTALSGPLAWDSKGTVQKKP
jgi:protein SCO1/2